DGPTADEALLQSLFADETGFVLHRTGQAHQGRNAVERTDRLGQATLAGTRVAGMTLEFAHPVELLALAKRDRVAPRVLVRERNHGRESGRASDVAARSPRAREAVIFFDRIGRPFGTFIDRSLADHEAARLADTLHAPRGGHEVVAPASGGAPALF